jgi:hypothetical protein
VDVLRGWRLGAEKAALAELEGREEHLIPDGFAELGLSVETRQQGSDRHDYVLSVVLSNLGTEPLNPYHVDLVFPRAVIHQPQNYVIYVADRSTRDTAFFRLISERDRKGDAIYPGDSKTVVKIEYFMTDTLFYGDGSLFNLPVRATLYQRAFGPITIEGVLRDFQNY